MPYCVNSEETEVDFKEPLSPTPARTASHQGSCHSIASTAPSRGRSPSPYMNNFFGLMGATGVIVSITIFALDLVSDALLAYALWTQANNEQNYYRQKEQMLWFTITIVIIAAPLTAINILSLIWYTQNKPAVGEYGVYKGKTIAEKIMCVGFHIVLLGPIVRYVDLLRYGRRIRKQNVRIDLGSKGAVKRLTPEGEVATVLQMQVLSRDTAMLDILHSFLQDSPQLVFQIFLLYRSPKLATSDVENLNLTLPAQLIKIMMGLIAISWSLVSYQDELRRSVSGRRQLSCGATNVCLLWRACMAAARILAIASFAALRIDGEGGLVKVYSDNAPRGVVLSFPAIAALILVSHWFIMAIWIYSQKTTFCHTEGGSRPLLEFLYTLVMAWVHVFCYVNMKDTPTRRRMFFFYALIFLENTSFMVIWYMQISEGAATGFLIGFAIGSFADSKEAYINFIRNNMTTPFKHHLEAKRAIQDAIILALARGGWRVGWRLSLFTTTLLVVITGMNTYRGSSSIIDFTTAGAITGGMYKFMQGPKPAIAGAVVGGSMGTVAGGIVTGFMTLAGVSFMDLYTSQHDRLANVDEKRLEKIRKKRATAPDLSLVLREPVEENKHDVKDNEKTPADTELKWSKETTADPIPDEGSADPIPEGSKETTAEPIPAACKQRDNSGP